MPEFAYVPSFSGFLIKDHCQIKSQYLLKYKFTDRN